MWIMSKMSCDVVTLTTLDNYLLLLVIVNICKDSSHSWAQTIIKYKFYKAWELTLQVKIKPIE